MLKTANFIKLSLDEMSLKLSILEKQKEVIKMWVRGEGSELYRVSQFFILKNEKERKAYLGLFSEGTDLDVNFTGRRVLFTFNLNDIDYFSEGVVNYDEIHKTLVIELDRDFFRSEKRTNERLLTYPHHQVYVYFKVKEEKEKSNVIKIMREEDQLYIDYKQKQKEELKDKLKEKVPDIEDLIGLRVLDISRSGVAFLVGDEEGKYFSEKAKYSFYILFDGDLFVVKGATLVYKVDYVGGKEGRSRFKVGLTFNPVENLTQYVSELLKEGVETDSIKREFEDFIDD